MRAIEKRWDAAVSAHSRQLERGHDCARAARDPVERHERDPTPSRDCVVYRVREREFEGDTPRPHAAPRRRRETPLVRQQETRPHHRAVMAQTVFHHPIRSPEVDDSVPGTDPRRTNACRRGGGAVFDECKVRFVRTHVRGAATLERLGSSAQRRSHPVVGEVSHSTWYRHCASKTYTMREDRYREEKRA